MTDIPLDAFVRRLSTVAERLFFKNNCVLAPFFVGHKPDGEVVTLAIRADLTKDEEAARMRAIAAQLDLVRCAYVDEAWTAQIAAASPEQERRAKAEIAIMNRIGVKHHPDRREVIIIAAEDYITGSLMGFRYILRPEHGKPSLSPLKIEQGWDQAEGRFVGLLPPRGTKQ